MGASEAFKELIDRFLGSTATVHLRGFHYILVSAADVAKPHDGRIYRNTDEDFWWLVEQASRQARWLGYVEFERIVDERSAAPEVYCSTSIASRPLVYLSEGVGISQPPSFADPLTGWPLVPSAAEVMPSLNCTGSPPPQPYRIVFIGEKVSLRPILRPIAQRVHGELILPTGELSDTHLYDMVKRAAADGRPTVVLYFSDFDPSGYWMPGTVSRRAQTLCDLRFPDLDIAVYPVALTFEQVRDLDLPSTPLKASELRGTRWRAHWGREQTEIDALAALQPDVLREIAERAVQPFYDPSMEQRFNRIAGDWWMSARDQLRAHPLYDETRAALTPYLDRAQAIIGHFHEGFVEEFRDRYDEFCQRLQAEAAALEEAQRAATERMDIAVPDPYELPDPPAPLYSSRDDWREATDKLRAYRDLGGALDPE